MLFAINPALGQLFASGGASGGQVNGLQTFALGVSEGNHGVTSDRPTLRALNQAPHINSITRAVFADAAANFAQRGALRQKILVCGELVINTPTGAPQSIPVGQQRIIQFPIDWFDSTAKVQPTVLLGENLDDVGVYTKIGQAGPILRGWGYLPLAINGDHGGGGTTAAVLADQVRHNHLCLCIVDSDRACPLGSLGNTAASIQRYKNAAEYPFVYALETPGRDLENSLPIGFLRCEFGANPTHRRTIELLDQVVVAGEQEIRLHIDMEKGITLRQVFGYSIGSEERNFWESKLDLIMASMGITAPALPCRATGTCAQLPPTQCTCVIVPHNPANMLHQFVREYREATPYELISLLDVSSKSDWDHIGAIIASWCCGSRKLRI